GGVTYLQIWINWERDTDVVGFALTDVLDIERVADQISTIRRSQAVRGDPKLDDEISRIHLGLAFAPGWHRSDGKAGTGSVIGQVEIGLVLLYFSGSIGKTPLLASLGYDLQDGTSSHTQTAHRPISGSGVIGSASRGNRRNEIQASR